MSERSLDDVLGESVSPAVLLRNSQAGPNVYPGVPPEFTNWRDEQLAWQRTCVLFNQSYHMAELAVRGPDALALLSHLGVNTFANFAVNKAKQFVPCTQDGYVIGDVILFHLDDDEFNMVGRAPVLNWVTFHAQTGDYEVEVERDERSAMRTDGRRRSYRFQIQGPRAMDVIDAVPGRAGWELFGPWDDGDAVREALVATGEEFGLRQVGGRAYSSNALESGWIPSPLPAIYTGDALIDYRRWLPAAGYEGAASIGGSFYSDDIEDYYFTPWDLGYGHLVKFDHEFIGRAALEQMARDDEHRVKVTLALDDDDVARTIGTMFGPGERAKFMDWPSAVYAMHPFDKVTVNGGTVGVSTWIGYSANEGKMLTLAVLDAQHAEPGTEVTLVWGEEDGGSGKPTVERHVQTELRAVVAPVPYVESVRRAYAPESWRATPSTSSR